MKSYIKYIKRQNRNVQDIHAVIFATIFTIIIASIYLQWRYHIFYPEYKEVIYVKGNSSLTKSKDESTSFDSRKEGGEIQKDFFKDIMEQKYTDNASNTIDLFMDGVYNVKSTIFNYR